MKELKNEYIYHVVTEKRMELGQKIVFGDKYNSLYDRVMNWQFLSEEGMDSLEIVMQKKFENMTEDDKATIRKYIYENAMITREYILEQVRKEKYPLYPSRMACLYCVRTLEDTKLWIDVFNRMKRPVLQIVKMKANGKIFDGDANGILRDAKSLNHKISLAEKYWQGLGENPYKESLFAGEVEVVEIVEEF